jgi:hypothetical protein
MVVALDVPHDDAHSQRVRQVVATLFDLFHVARLSPDGDAFRGHVLSPLAAAPSGRCPFSLTDGGLDLTRRPYLRFTYTP